MDEDDKKLKEILVAADNGENIILHAPGGTGKTFCLKKIAIHLKEQGKNVFCTATTGVAAINLNIPEAQITASTLHSFAGVGLAQGAAKKLLAKVMIDDYALHRWMCAHTLIIDEVSMLGGDFLDKLDFIGRGVRQINKPFGGIQIIFSGDFLQLPPVKDEWVFKSCVWDELDLVPIIFDEPKRYDDLEYFQLLLRIREGTHTKDDIKKLRARTRAHEKYLQILEENEDNLDFIKPTTLYSKKVDVDFDNNRELDKLPGDLVEYIAEDNFTAYNSHARYEHYIKILDDAMCKVVSLKVGAQVMLKVNLDVSAGLVNGSRGVVLETNPKYVYVRFINGRQMKVKKKNWEVEDKDGKATRYQIPFILAWACTIHKGQGSTLDFAIADLGPSVFAEGQAYVALSRVRNIKGLFISEFYPACIKVNKKALKQSRYLEQKSKEVRAPGYKKKLHSESDSDSEDIEDIRNLMAGMRADTPEYVIDSEDMSDID